MKAVELQLQNGKWIFFVFNGTFSLRETESKIEGETVAVLEDGTHNNGGWVLMDDYSTVKQNLIRWFNLEGN